MIYFDTQIQTACNTRARCFKDHARKRTKEKEKALFQKKFPIFKQNSLEIMSGKKEMTPNRVVNWPFRTL